MNGPTEVLALHICTECHEAVAFGMDVSGLPRLCDGCQILNLIRMRGVELPDGRVMQFVPINELPLYESCRRTIAEKELEQMDRGEKILWLCVSVMAVLVSYACWNTWLKPLCGWLWRVL